MVQSECLSNFILSWLRKKFQQISQHREFNPDGSGFSLLTQKWTYMFRADFIAGWDRAWRNSLQAGFS
jgi:hypothetical protein